MMPQMTITITDIFNVLDKLITAKRIILMIEILYFLQNVSRVSYNCFSGDPEKTLHNSIHLNMMIDLCIF